MAKAAGSKTGKLKTEVVRSKDIKIDPEFYGGNEEVVIEKGIYAKFSQNNDLKKMLLKTQTAKLLHYKRGSEPEISNSLMIVRNRLR